MDNFFLGLVEEFYAPDKLYPESGIFHLLAIFFRYRIGEVYRVDRIVVQPAVFLQMSGPGRFGLDVGYSSYAPGFCEMIVLEKGLKPTDAYFGRVGILAIVGVAFRNRLSRSDTKNDFVIFFENPPDHRLVSCVLGLEAAQKYTDFFLFFWHSFAFNV